MGYGIGRQEVFNETSAKAYGWVPADLACPLLQLFTRKSKENGNLYIKGCEHAGIFISQQNILMEVPCPQDCFYKKMNE